jgi:hypothetical protein
MHARRLRIDDKLVGVFIRRVSMHVWCLLRAVPLVAIAACAGPQVPAGFAPRSAASPSTAAPARSPVAAVLAHENPLEAPACADAQERAVPCPAPEGGHDHAGHEAAGGDTADGGSVAPPAPDHSQHGAAAKAEKPRQKASEPEKSNEAHQHHHH